MHLIIHLASHSPISFSIHLFKFNGLVNNPICSFGCSVTRKTNPHLIVNNSPQQKWKYQKVGKIFLLFILNHV